MRIYFSLQKRKKGFVVSYRFVNGNDRSSQTSTGIFVEKNMWDKKTQRIVTNDMYGHKLEFELQEIKKLFYENLKIFENLTPTQAKITFNKFGLKKFNSNKPTTIFLNGFFENRNMKANSLKKVESILNKYILTPAPFIQSLNQEKINQIKEQVEVSNNQKSTQRKKLQIIKAFLNYLYEKDLIPAFKLTLPKNPPPKPITTLTTSELQQLEQLELPTEKLERIKDLFLFQCYTGMSYSDTQNFKMGWVEKNKHHKTLKFNRQKTSTGCIVYLTNGANNIIKKYNGQLPKISNQKYNDYIKILVSAITKKNITSHVARKTFSTNYLNSGGSYEVLTKMVGHRSVKTTEQAYAQVNEIRVINEAKKILK